MKKIKFFTGISLKGIETKVNEFMENSNIRIIDFIQVTDEGLTFCLIYEEVTRKPYEKY